MRAHGQGGRAGRPACMRACDSRVIITGRRTLTDDIPPPARRLQVRQLAAGGGYARDALPPQVLLGASVTNRREPV